MRTEPLQVCREDGVFSLRRINDHELHRLGRHAGAIEEDLLFWMQRLSRHSDSPLLLLAEVYVAMSELFGASGLHFDDYKSSFSFPFRLTTTKGTNCADYLLLVEDWKGGLTTRLYRRDGKVRSRLAGFEKFVDAEFSRDDFRYLVNYLEGFLRGYLKSTDRMRRMSPLDRIPDFVNHAEAALLLYGYRDGEPFEEHFDDDAAYRRALARTPEHLAFVDIGETP